MRTNRTILAGLLGRCTALLGAMAVVWTGGCASGSSLDDFDITRSAETVIKGSLLSQVLSSLGFAGLSDMQLSNSAEMKNQGVKPNQIDSVRLKLMRLRVKSPAGQDLTFFKSIQFFAESQGLEKKLVAKGGPFAAGATQVDLQLVDADLKAYVTAPSMSLTTAVDGHPPPQDTTIEATVTLRVDVNVTGAVTGN